MIGRPQKYKCPCGRHFTHDPGIIALVECPACGRTFSFGLGPKPRPFSKARELERFKRQQARLKGKKP